SSTPPSPAPALAGSSLVPHTGPGNVLRLQNNVKVAGNKRDQGWPKDPLGRIHVMTDAKPVHFALAALIAALFATPAAAQGATWRHALLTAKADAGFLMLSARHGFAEKP